MPIGPDASPATTTGTTTGSRYLAGNYGPVAEEVTAFDLPVIGDGMVHGIRLRGDRAEWYRNRYVGSSALSAARGVPDIAGRNWNDSPFGPNTNVGGFAGTNWAMVEAGSCPVELSYELETVGRNDFSGTLPGAFTAHSSHPAIWG